jgi:hypothetical protein
MTATLPGKSGLEEKKLPAICLNYFIFPFIKLRLSPPFGERLDQAFVGALQGKNSAECLLMFRDPHEKTPSKFIGMLDVGTVASIERSGDDFDVAGLYRANVLSFEKDRQRKRLGWTTIEKRPDVPAYEEVENNLQHSELPMLLGCVESILRLLKEIHEKIVISDEESKKFKERLEGQIRRLKNELREPYTPYQICWYVPGITLDHISDLYKTKILLEDRVADRLQLVMEALQMEKRILVLQNGLLSEDVGGLDKCDPGGK